MVADESLGRSNPRTDEQDARTYTTPAIHLTPETEMAVWGINWSTDNEQVFTYSVLEATTPPIVEMGSNPSEFAIRDVAAVFGAPDFVFNSVKVSKKRGGTYELGGDGIILCGSRGVIIQSKNRKGRDGTGELRDAAEEATWLRSSINEGYRQACGSIRRMATAPVTLNNRRGRPVLIDGKNIDWTIVIVIDHNKIPLDFDPSVQPRPGRAPAIVILRRDWDFLYRHLWSNYAVIDYFRRVRAKQVPLGAEPMRYAEYALHDLGPGLEHIREAERNTQFLQVPGDPVQADELGRHLTLRIIMEEIAESGPEFEAEQGILLSLLTTLDAIPVIFRTALGEHISSQLSQVREHGTSGSLAGIRLRGQSDGRPFAVFIAVASEQSTTIEEALFVNSAECHEELVSSTCRTDSVTIGIILVPQGDSNWHWLLSCQDGRFRSAINPE